MLKKLSFHDGALLFALTFLVYCFGLNSPISGGDSGELAAAAYNWGVAHPPGYPLYTLLLKLFFFIPLPLTLATKGQLLSALFAAGASLFLYLGGKKLFDHLMALFVAVLFSSLTPLGIKYSTTIEVFALNQFLICLLFYFIVSFHFSPQKRTGGHIALICGLALCNHHISLVYVLPSLSYIFLRRPNLLYLPLFLIGLLPYLYLVVAANPAHPASWGDTANWSGFWHHISRSDYGSFQLAAGDSPVDFLANLQHFAITIKENFSWTGGFAAFIGLILILQNWRKHSLLVIYILLSVKFILLFAALSNLPLNVGVHREMLSRFWLQVFPCLGLSMAVTFSEFFKAAKGEQLKVLNLVVYVAIAGIVLSKSLLAYSHSSPVETFSSHILDDLPAQSILLTQGDHITNPLRYRQSVQQKRVDVDIIDMEKMKYPWLKEQYSQQAVNFPGLQRRSPLYPGYSLAEFAQRNSHRPFFVCNGFHPLPPSLSALYDTWTSGLCRQLVAKKHMPELSLWQGKANELIEVLQTKNWQQYHEDSWEKLVHNHYLEALHYHSANLLQYAVSVNQNSIIEEAIQQLLVFNELSHKIKPAAYKNLGIAYMKLSNIQSDYKHRGIEAWKIYIKNADPKDPGKQAVLNKLKSMGL